MDFGDFVQPSQRDDPNRPQGSVSNAHEGAIIEVYWPDDNAWYKGTVGAIDAKVRFSATTSVCVVVKVLSRYVSSNQELLFEFQNERGR
jgi:hypothetical protein